jgi:hypothetical protein
VPRLSLPDFAVIRGRLEHSLALSLMGLCDRTRESSMDESRRKAFAEDGAVLTDPLHGGDV